jgi:hypothetical protein
MEAIPTAAPATYSYRQRRQEAVAASGHRLLHPSLAHLRPVVPPPKRTLAMRLTLVLFVPFGP